MGDQWTQHLYTYTANNPVMMTDPTGHWGISITGSAGEDQQIIAQRKKKGLSVPVVGDEHRAQMAGSTSVGGGGGTPPRPNPGPNPTDYSGTVTDESDLPPNLSIAPGGYDINITPEAIRDWEFIKKYLYGVEQGDGQSWGLYDVWSFSQEPKSFAEAAWALFNATAKTFGDIAIGMVAGILLSAGVSYIIKWFVDAIETGQPGSYRVKITGSLDVVVTHVTWDRVPELLTDGPMTAIEWTNKLVHWRYELNGLVEMYGLTNKDFYKKYVVYDPYPGDSSKYYY